MKYEISNYSTLLFDCDGVVLNSNGVKNRAFYQAALPYGELAAQALVDFNVANGGMSRYKKFAHFLETIVPAYSTSVVGPNLEALIRTYAKQVWQGLITCEVAPGLQALREHTSRSTWLIISGGDQSELRELFTQRSLSDLFNGGIFGSPDTKDEILAREVENGLIKSPTLYLGDSKYDYIASTKAKLDFVFLTGWSEVSDWQGWVVRHKISYHQNLSNLIGTEDR